MVREDLYYRLNVFQIHLPPLRERKGDIPVIVETLIHSLNRKHGTKIQGASAAFIAAMLKLDWAGNVRELRNAVERAVIIAGEGTLEPKHAAFTLLPADGVKSGSATPGTGLAIEVGMTIDEAEKVLIQATLDHAGNNKTRAASILGTSTKTLHAKLRQYRLAESEAVEEELVDER